MMLKQGMARSRIGQRGADHVGEIYPKNVMYIGRLGRAHRSHRWGHRFESCCDHHSPSENTVFGRIFYA